MLRCILMILCEIVNMNSQVKYINAIRKLNMNLKHVNKIDLQIHAQKNFRALTIYPGGGIKPIAPTNIVRAF